MTEEGRIAVSQPINPLLLGVVGSTAYGLAHEGSDIDRLGMFAAPTHEFHGLSRPAESLVRTGPDVTWHEAGKALRLIMSCNPTASEILWLDAYEISTPLGEELVGMRKSLLSAQGVRNAYLGYASQQFTKMKNTQWKMDNREDPDRVHAKRLKHARHLIRLVQQGVRLHERGELLIRLDDPQGVRDLAGKFCEDHTLAAMWLKVAEKLFDKPGVLPEHPDTVAAERWLLKVRAHFYHGCTEA